MKYIYWAGAILLTLFLQARISVLGISPDLPALLAFYAGIRFGETRGLLIGSVIGGAEDILGLAIIGPNLLGKGLVGYFAASFISGGWLRWTPLLGIITVFILTTLDNAVVFTARSLFDVRPAPTNVFFLLTTMQSLLNAAAGPFLRPRHAD